MKRVRYIFAGLLSLSCAIGITFAQFGGGAAGGAGGGIGGMGGGPGGGAGRGTGGAGRGGGAGGRGRMGGGPRGTAADGTPVVYLNGDPYGMEADGRLYSWPRRPSDLSDRRGIPTWDIDPHFKGNIFTFARVNYHSWRYSDSWATTYPTGDLNFSFRLQELTSFQVNPNPVVVKFTDKELFDYPLVYMVDAETLEFEDDAVPALRKYLLNGGFLLIDDTWHDAESWPKIQTQLKRVFPDRDAVELDITHPIFHQVFDLKKLPQIPKITQWAVNHQGDVWTPPADGREPHYRAFFDDKGRMMMLICQNTDLSDGWSRELSLSKLPQFRDQNLDPATSLAAANEGDQFFHQFCEKQGYPMGVNIVTYVMTH